LGAAGFAQDLMSNPDYQKGLEYQDMAQKAYDEGNFDQSIEYSTSAQECFQRAKKYAEDAALRYSAANLKKMAQERLEFADSIDAAQYYPDEYGPALESFKAAELAFSTENYAESVPGYRNTIDLLKDLEPVVPEPTEELALANELRGVIDEYGFAAVRPTETQRGDTAREAGEELMGQDNAQAQQLLASAIVNYKAAIGGAVDFFSDQRRAELEAAQKAADDADAASLAEAEYTNAHALHANAERLLQNGDYSGAWEESGAAIQAYNDSAALAVARTLPEYYTVRLLPGRRDCLWRIAGYDFVYGDPHKWRLLYEENKKLLKNPNDPDVIQPGTRLRIPAQPGEKRKGDWTPSP
jgi:nucleoid-associated protein YgaU